MALFADSRHFCKLTHVENGRCFTRRVHELTIQLPNGMLHRMKGSALPDAIILNTGFPNADGHTLDILLRVNQPRLTLTPLRNLLGKRTQWLLVAFVAWVIFTILVLASLAHSSRW